MKKICVATMIVGAVAALTFANVPAANAKDAFSFSFNTGNVAFAYSDGYWDRDHKWHDWRNSREHREYRTQYAGNYKASRHSRERNKGWRNDMDHDGVPNQVDRDRDGDGRPNERDRRPNTPNRE